DRILQFYSASFDASIWETTLALTAGATLITTTHTQRHSPQQLAHHITHHTITLATLPPTILAELTPHQTPTLHTLLATGEHLPTTTATTWQHPHLTLINGYGPTETTIGVIMGQLHPTHTTNPPPIGTPLANNTALILDRHLNPVPTGIPGELYIAGPQLARGYHHRPALTAERFIANPHTTNGTRLYRTGDLARQHPNGHLQHLGRTDTQTKIRGYRIETTEIETTLTTHPNI
ncbi:AMP-binding protein, partial [Actinomadura sp. 9N215]|uniref:AMP-binding protein n=1 Tax=Actinomadura sp. 9N215 TaxID=3375150 RepID=UPI0037A5630C